MRVIMVAASTVCGRINPAGMGSLEDRHLLEMLRERTDASLMGAGTLRAEDPRMRGSGDKVLSKRIRAIVTFSGEIPVMGKKVFQDGNGVVVFTRDAVREKLEQKVGKTGSVIALPEREGGLSLRAAISTLAAMGAESVLVEGGGNLNYRSLEEGIVDEIHLTLTPKISGDANGVSLVSGPLSLGRPFLDLELLSCIQGGYGELFLRYKILSRPVWEKNTYECT